jgi:mannose-6-phosphate isomerase-like protein (cupin superfamily)
MPIQRLSARDVTVLKNPGKDSEQLVWHRNAPDASMTITRVTMQPGAESTLHAHQQAEQIWLIERGAGTLLMAEDVTAEVKAGDIIRTPAGEAHGTVNSGNEPLIYLAITVPPEDFTSRYAEESLP